MSDKGGKTFQDLLNKHRRDVENQNRLYGNHLRNVIRNIPIGAGLPDDDLSKEASIEVIGASDPTEALKK